MAYNDLQQDLTGERETEFAFLRRTLLRATVVGVTSRLGVSAFGIAAADEHDEKGDDNIISYTDTVDSVNEDSDSNADAEVHASEGAGNIQAALNNADADEVVHINGDGEYEWESEIVVPNHVTLDVSNEVSVSVPSDHNLTPYTLNGSEIYSLITNANRSTPENVTIRGGEYNFGEMTESADYAGVWLHNAEDSLIDNVIVRGAGAPVYGSSTHRSFGVCLTACHDCAIRDSESYDSGYDDFGIRGGNTDCRIVRSGGSGGSSGTTQTAQWGGWGLNVAPSNTTFEDCSGPRIYCHGGSDTTWDNCQSDYRLQTIGTDNALLKNTEDYEGKILLYTLDSGSNFSRIENMSFSPDSSQTNAIQIGTNGPNHGTIEIDNVSGERQRFIRFAAYPNGGSVDTVEVTDCEFRSNGNDTAIISQEDDAPEADMLRVKDCVFHDFAGGITGSYDSVRVYDCEFHNVSGDPIDVDSDDVDESDNEEY